MTLRKIHQFNFYFPAAQPVYANLAELEEKKRVTGKLSVDEGEATTPTTPGSATNNTVRQDCRLELSVLTPEYTRDARFGTKVGQISPKLDKS